MRRFVVAAVLCPLLVQAAVDRAFLKELLEIPSVTADISAVNRAAELTQGWLERNGVRCQVETDDEGRKILWAATVEGKTPDYVLVGHLDVVPAEADQFRVRIDGDRIFARGAHDNKGNAALACDVLKRLNGKASVGAIFAANEEMGGSTVALLVRRGYRPRKMAIVLDAGTYGVYYAQKGNAYLTVRATGKGGHSSQALWLDNPIAKLTQGYEKFRQAWPSVPKDGWGDLVVPTVIRAGQAENAIPDTAEMVLNVRSVSTDAVERVTKTLKDAAGLEVVKVRTTGQPMASDPDDPEIQRLLAERRARWPEKNGSLQRMLAITDARHFAGLGVPVVITGSMGGNAHGKDEWGDMRNMDENADSLVAFVGDEGPGRAFRGIWLSTLADARFAEDLSKKSVDGIKTYWRSMLDAAAKVSVNAVFFQVRPCADAFYAGSLEPWSQHLRGEQGKAPEGGFDPLQFMIDECHARGLQLHAWFNPFRVTYEDGDEKRLAKDHNYFRHPDWFVKYGKSVYYDPGVPACRDWTVKVVLDVVSRYDVDGVHIDDYFYPYFVKDKAGKILPFPDEKSFATYGGGFTDVNAWRDDNSDRLVEDLARRLRELKPDVVFGVAPFNDHGYCLKYLHCDSIKWAKRGWIDYLLPQLYYGENCRRDTFWWDAQGAACPIIAGRWLKYLSRTVEKGPRKGMSELDNALAMHTEMTNCTGVCWWPGNLMATSQSNVVARLAPHYAKKTLVPLYRDRSRTPPAAVTEVRTEARDGRVRLTWRHPAPSAGRPKAVFTAVFRGDAAQPEIVTDRTEVLLEGGPGDIFRLVALDRLQNASEPMTAAVSRSKVDPADVLEMASAADGAADAAVAAIRTPAELSAKQAAWRQAWIEGLGGLPERTPLNAQEGPVVKCDGFTLQNVLFESQPGVYVVGHLALPDSTAFKPPYPAVLMPMGHSDCGLLAPRYAAHLAMMARAGFAAFSWDPIGQGERRQCSAKFDGSFSECATEHTRLGARGWLVGWNFARFRLWDGIRALDWLETRQDVDCSKVGVCGTSGGGTMSAYLQALDPRIKVAFPNCYVSSIRAVFAERGCHDAEQFFWNQLNVGVNHAAMLAMGLPRVSLATGSRWKDYFPHAGAVSTFAAYSNLVERVEGTFSPFHFHCDGPHGLPLPTRQAQVDWMTHCIKGGAAPKPLADYWALSTGDHSGANDPCVREPLPFPTNAALFTATHFVRDLKGFRSVYDILADRAKALAKARQPKTREQLREIVRRRANIRPLAELCGAGGRGCSPLPVFDHPRFGWWYLKGAYGSRRENEAAMLATLGRTVIGRDAERIILNAVAEIRKAHPEVTTEDLLMSSVRPLTADLGPRIPLKAASWDCIAAAHAYAAEPQLFSGLELKDPPPSWTAMVANPDPKGDSFAIGVWGALEEYDWTDLVPTKPLPGQGEDKLYDGRLGPTCAWPWEKKPIEVVTDFGEEREVGGVRFWAGRSWISRGVKKARFYAITDPSTSSIYLGSFDFRPAHTFKQSFATWKPVKCRGVRMVIEDAWEPVYGYYMWYMHLANRHIRYIFDTPPYTVNDTVHPHVEIAELEYFRDEPDDLPKPNRDGSVAYPESRLAFDWALQSCAVSNISHCANVEPDTTKPDPLGESLAEKHSVESLNRLVRDAEDVAPYRRRRQEFLKGFREICDEFVYVKHLVIGNSIMHATDDMTDASFLEWKSVPDYKTGAQLIRAKINEDGTVSQEVLVDEPDGIIRDPSLDFDCRYVVFSKRSSMTKDNYHLWKYDFATKKLTQLTFEPTLPRELVPGQTNDFPLVCADTEPCVLADGSIVFQSTRVCHSVDCWPLPTTNLYRCDPDGRNIRRIGFDQIQTFYPQVLEDGRVAFTRWEYQDRSASGSQQLYAMNPDGTRQMGLFANNSEWPFSLIHCRGIPGSDKLVAISAGHHAAQKGKFVELDPSAGDDYTCQTYDPSLSVYGMSTNDIVYDPPGPGFPPFVVKWTPYDNPCGPAVTNYPGMHYLAGASMDARPGRVPAKQPKDYQYNVYDMHTQFGPQWAYPFALDDGHYLVSFMPEGCRYYRGPYSSRFGVYAMDRSGRRELLAFDWGNHCLQPVALMPRRKGGRRALKKLDYREGFGTYYVQNVYHGAAAEGLEPGSVKKLRVIALEYRPVHNGWNWQYGWHSSQGKIGTPVSVGNGAYDVKHVFGEADVEADGSCMFRCPARAPVYFQLIDQDGLCLQTMRSWSTLMPGEANSCTGCHEHPNEAAPIKRTIASRKPPQDLKSAIPGRPRHPLLDRLEKEGPLASLRNWMGVNRAMSASADEIAAKGIPPEERGDGVGFVKDIQPIFDRLQAQCPGVKILGLDLTDTPAKLPPTDDRSMRTYSHAYLEFTDKGKGTDNVNFAHGLSFVAFKPPKSFGAIRSKRYWEIAKGWPDANGKPRFTISDADRRMLALWIDLGIPYCSNYTERHTWDVWHQQRYLYTYDKRIYSYWLELDEIRKSLGMESVPLTGFVPNVTEPRKQKYWYE